MKTINADHQEEAMKKIELPVFTKKKKPLDGKGICLHIFLNKDQKNLILSAVEKVEAKSMSSFSKDIALATAKQIMERG